MADSAAPATGPSGRLQAVSMAAPGRLALWATALIGLVVIWIAPRPPMIDLPQHAGQVALLRDLLFGRSRWAPELTINFVTPYLIGYGLALPLSLVMPVAAAIKTVTSFAYAGYVAGCLAIRRELKAPPQLDAFYLVPFFGFAYGWGLYTFLVAAPVGLAFIWLALKYARAPKPATGAGLAALGLALLFCHGLLFLVAAGIGGLLLLVRAKRFWRFLFDAWPYAILLAACAALFVITRDREAALTAHFARRVDMGPVLVRVAALSVFTFDSAAGWARVAFVAFALLPFLAGLRLQLRDRERLVIAGSIFAVMALVPGYAWSTSLLYQRFALFALPAYAWLFGPEPSPTNATERAIASRAGGLALAAAAVVLALHAVQAWRFSGEAEDFDTVLARAEPGQRALSLMFDTSSDAGVDSAVYLHFPLWYQAEKHGFVDFNFAVFHPQVVRMNRREQVSRWEDLAWNPEHFDWRADHGDRYRYFFVRHSQPLPPTLFAGAPCPPVRIVASGEWELYEAKACLPSAVAR